MSLRPDLQLVNGMVAAFGSLALAAITYYLTKQRERDAELRSESLAHYKVYVESINGIIGSNGHPKEATSMRAPSIIFICLLLRL